MTLRLQTFLTGFLALLTAALLALASAGAKPASGGYQLFEQAVPEHQHTIQLAALGNFDYHAKIAPECCNATNSALNVPGRVQSRVNLANGSTRYTPLNDAGNPVASGWDHVVSRHFGGTNTQSQFTLSQSEVRGILQSDRVVSAPVTEVKMINGTPTYVRTVDVGQPVGTVRQSQGGGSTSRITVQTDSAGNLITAYPVP